MTAARKTLGISLAAGEPKADMKAGFAVTGKRLETLKERAKDQRRNPTEAQKLLWEQLSGSRLGGVKFTRQSVVGSSIVDFAAPSRWIVVQISPDGANGELEALQDRKLSQVGVRVLRFAEAEVLEDAEGVIATINTEVNKPFDKRSARRGVPAPKFVEEGAER